MPRSLVLYLSARQAISVGGCAQLSRQRCMIYQI